MALTVRDHGIGIPTSKLDTIFLQFSRGVSGKRYPGLGIGLWVAKQIVDAHGGVLSVVSALGKGSTFKVVLPRTSPGLSHAST